MSSAIRVHGVDEVALRLGAEIKKIRGRTLGGMIAGGLIIQKAAQRLAPVDVANLKASAFTIWGKSGTTQTGFFGKGTTKSNFKGDDAAEMKADHAKVLAEEKAGLPKGLRAQLFPEVEVGFSAYYAIYVHEDTQAKHVTGQAKFLQKALADNIPAVLAAIKSGGHI